MNIAAAPIFLDKHTELISFSDPLGRIRSVSPSFCRCSGFDRKELTGRTYRIINHPEMPSVIFKHMWRDIRNGKPTETIILNRTKEGKNLWLHTKVVPRIHNHNGVIYAYASYQKSLSANAVQKIVPLYQTLIELQKSVNFKESEVFLEQFLIKEQKSLSGFLHEVIHEKPARTSFLKASWFFWDLMK